MPRRHHRPATPVPPDRHPQHSTPRPPQRSRAATAPPPWNAGLQTGTRGAPHRARPHPTRIGRLPPRPNSPERQRRQPLGTPVSRPARAVLRTAPDPTPPGPDGSPLGAKLQNGNGASHLERRSPDRHARCSAPRPAPPHPDRTAPPSTQRSRAATAPAAWNAGLQTGTRGAPHRARPHPTRTGRLPPRPNAPDVKRQVKIGLKRHELCHLFASLAEASVLASGGPPWHSARSFG